ncbi:aldose 1-epimerase [Spirosoma sp. 209]|uniref:aldose 1-epimerase n=1 Tax=Spirosoma sp. 209 TaxID=1955701 RepID=UPI00098D57A2|nr:aldose epimerase [Spirosoma sp. 209]
MPFLITQEPFGPLATDSQPLTEYLLEHTETGEFISIIPAYGGILRRLVLRKGNDLYALLKSPESPQALLADETYASAFLFPFASRIRHGIYSFEGQDYALKMNEGSRDNALHGFVHGREFTVIDQDTSPTHAQLTIRYTYEGDTVGYPFPFTMTITYELVQGDQLRLGSNYTQDRMCALRVSYEIINTGTTACPAAFGWHPYFMFTEESVDNMTLSLPARMPIVLDGNMIPNGRLGLLNAETIPLKDVQLDSPFAIEPTGIPAEGDPFAETMLTSLRTGVRLIIGQQTGPGKLNYLVCYTPGRRDSVAIEPQTSNVNAFNNGEGLAVLDPGDALSGSMWVRLD